MSTKTKAWLNLALFLLTIAVNALGAFGVIGGMSQREVSDKYPTLITPSPFTFSIWSVIYALLLVALVYMIVKSDDPRAARLVDRISVPFWLTSLFNILWIVIFSYELVGLSTVFIFLLVLSLAWLVTRLSAPEALGDRATVLAFGLYTGWLVIATVVNASACLVQIGWNGFGLSGEAWAGIILVVAIAVSTLVQMRLSHAALTLPLAWAYYGIWSAHRAAGQYNGQYPLVGIVALAGAAVYVLIAVYVFIRNGMCVLPKSRAETRP